MRAALVDWAQVMRPQPYSASPGVDGAVSKAESPTLPRLTTNRSRLLATIREEGYLAKLLGAAESDCPYRIDHKPQEHSVWQSGWISVRQLTPALQFPLISLALVGENGRHKHDSKNYADVSQIGFGSVNQKKFPHAVMRHLKTSRLIEWWVDKSFPDPQDQFHYRITPMGKRVALLLLREMEMQLALQDGSLNSCRRPRES